MDTRDWPRIAEVFKGRSIFITGATGFMGKVLIEKLLYSCPDVNKIYMLTRPKRGKGEETRIAEMLKLPLFERIRTERPGSASKLVCVSGDLSAEGLGLSPEHRAMLQREVSIVFHSAATLKLEAPLKDSLLQNTCGTACMLELARGMTNLVAFIHSSTAFCHVDQLVLEEKTYEPLYEPEDMMRSLTWLSGEMLETLRPKILPPHPNTYTFSKRLAETLVQRASVDMPCAIVRPSIVVPAWKEPMPGWVDSLNGPVGLMVAAGKGVLRSMHCNKDYHAEVIPVDVAINGLIAVAWKRICDKSKTILVYNATQGRQSPITWGEVLDKGKHHIYDYPYENTIWYPDGDIRSNKFIHTLCVIFFHYVPALFIDLLLTIFAQKRFMIRIQNKITDGLGLLQYFTTKEWVFDNSNFLDLKNQLGKADNAEFFTDCSEIEHEDYLKHCILGARTYCLKEDPATLPSCRRNIRRLYWIQKLTTVLFYGYLIYWVLSWSETAMHAMEHTGALVKDSLGSIPFARLLPGTTK